MAGEPGVVAVPPVAWSVSTRGKSRLDRGGYERVHAALGHLASLCRAARLPLPLVQTVTVDPSAELSMHLAAPLPPPPRPWRARSGTWRVDLSAVPDRRDETQGAPGDRLDAWPALVEVGRTGRRAVLVDLAAAPGLIELSGPAGVVRQMQTRIAAALRAAPWSQRVGIHVVGDPSANGHGNGPERDRPSSAGEDPTLRELLPPGWAAPGGVTGRWGAPPRDAHDVVLLTRPATDEERALVRSASRLRSVPTVIAPGAPDAPGRAGGVWRWALEAGSLRW